MVVVMVGRGRGRRFLGEPATGGGAVGQITRPWPSMIHLGGGKNGRSAGIRMGRWWDPERRRRAGGRLGLLFWGGGVMRGGGGGEGKSESGPYGSLSRRVARSAEQAERAWLANGWRWLQRVGGYLERAAAASAGRYRSTVCGSAGARRGCRCCFGWLAGGRFPLSLWRWCAGQAPARATASEQQIECRRLFSCFVRLWAVCGWVWVWVWVRGSVSRVQAGCLAGCLLACLPACLPALESRRCCCCCCSSANTRRRPGRQWRGAGFGARSLAPCFAGLWPWRIDGRDAMPSGGCGCGGGCSLAAGWAV